MRLPVPPALLLASGIVLLAAGATVDTQTSHARAGHAGDPVDSARAEMEIGRHWHAARILRPIAEAGGLDAEERLLLGRAEAGYRNWSGVRDVLEGAEWLGEVEEGRGWRLLARALEEGGRWADAGAAWDRYLSSAAGRADPDRGGLVARRARARAREVGPGAGAAPVDSMRAAEGDLASWLALELVGEASRNGDTATVARLRQAMDVPEPRRRSWEAMARARLAARDSAGAVEAYLVALDALPRGAERGRAWAAVGSLHLEAGDTSAARGAFLEALDAAPRGGSASGAARRLLEIGGLDAGRALQVARALDRGGDHRAALEAYELHASLTPEPLPAETRLDRARLLSLVSGRQDEALAEFRRLDGALDNPDLAVRLLSLWMDLRRREGRSAQVSTLQDWLLARHPASAEAVEIVFFRGDAAHDRGALDEAVRHYTRLQGMNSSLDRSGLARMRTAQIHMGLGDADRALQVYRAYLEEYPEGRRWDQASYWIGRILADQGDASGSVAMLRSIGERDPLSYYAVQAAELLDEPYRPRLDGDLTPEPLPSDLAEELRRADLLDVAGLRDGRDATLESLTERALETSPGVALTLARDLQDRGFAIEAVNLGWELRGRGVAWSRDLLQTIYPLLYREMVERAAAERGVDPLMVAALIRQESAFDADIVSVAGAVGLMQVIPATGRELSRREGPAEFSIASLEEPEINLHLGTRFFRDMWDRYGGDLTLVLSAYNAGPSRATRWSAFPEAGDPLRFTERIPFRETRDYVKQVTRNLALYEVLYGDL